MNLIETVSAGANGARISLQACQTEWGKTRTNIPDGVVIQVGPFFQFRGDVDLEL